MDHDNSLEHFGIPGMRWGRRKARKNDLKKAHASFQNDLAALKKSGKQNDLDSVNKVIQKFDADKKAIKAKYSADHIKKVELKKKRISAMSNEEIRTLANRLQLEKQYKDLQKQDVSKGRKFVEDILKDVLKETVKSSIKTAIAPKKVRKK